MNASSDSPGTGAESEGALEGLRFSADPWVDARCRRALEEAVPRIRELLRDRGVRLIFLSGSGACGQAVGWKGRDPFVLSDLDVGVVTAERVAPGVAAALRGQLAEIRRDRADPEVTVGSYPIGLLSRQIATPGLLEFLDFRCVLWGDPQWFFRFPALSEPSPWEAFRLVGNRSRELLCVRRADAPPAGESGPGPDAARAEVEAHYALAKLGEAIGTAWLIVMGRYSTDRSVRWSRLAADDVPERVQAVVCGSVPFLREPTPGTGSGVPLGRVRSALFDLLQLSCGSVGLGILTAYEYDPLGLIDRLRAWRRQAPHRDGTRVAWALRSHLRGTPEVRELGAAVLYWLALPERPEPDWGDSACELDGAGQRIEPTEDQELWRLAARLLGQSLPRGPGSKERLRVCLGLPGET